jgi:hypothetical protein
MLRHQTSACKGSSSSSSSAARADGMLGLDEKVEAFHKLEEGMPRNTVTQ